MRHAKAKHVDIILNKNKEHIILSINDDGIGMEKVAETTHNSFGILGMKERAYSLGGFLSISSKLDKGTNIILNIPIDMGQS
jgi:signal transduction histidine kinase